MRLNEIFFPNLHLIPLHSLKCTLFLAKKPSAIGRTYASYAHILAKMQHHDKALKMYEESYQYYRADGSLKITCEIDLKMAECYLS